MLNKFTKKEEQQICNEYFSEEKPSILVLSEKWSCSTTAIRNTIIRNGYTLRTNSEANKGRKVWNKNLTKETDERVAKIFSPERNRKISEAHKNIPLSEEHKRNMHIFTKEQEKEIERQYRKEKVSCNILAKKYKCCGDSIRNAIIRIGGKIRTLKEAQNTESCKNLLRQNNSAYKGKLCGKNNPMYGKHRSEEEKQSMREKVLLQIQTRPSPSKNTKPELKMKEILNELNIPFEHQFRLGNYLYDFHILDTNILIEVDGDYWHGNPKIYKKLSKKQKESRQRDIIKERLAKNSNYILLRFWQSDILKNTEKIVENLKGLING